MNFPNRVRVFIASDGRVHRESLSRLVATEEGLELVGAAKIAESPASLHRGSQPDVVLVDATQPSDLMVARRIASAAGEAHMVVLVAPDQGDDLRAWAGAGASGFLSSEASSEQLVDILARAAEGETPCSSDVAEGFLRRECEKLGEALASDRQLTTREAQIAELVVDGLSNKAIASSLSIELATVKNHVHRILEKLRVHSRGEAAAKLRQTGLIRS